MKLLLIFSLLTLFLTTCEDATSSEDEEDKISKTFYATFVITSQLDGGRLSGATVIVENILKQELWRSTTNFNGKSTFSHTQEVESETTRLEGVYYIVHYDDFNEERGEFYLDVRGHDVAVNLTPSDQYYDNLLFSGVAVSETAYNTVPIIAVHKDGDLMAIIANSDRTHVTGVSHRSVGGNWFSVIIGANGLPSVASMSGYLFIYDNYRDNYVDVAIISPSGDIQIIRDIYSENLIGLTNLRFALEKNALINFSFHDFTHFASSVLSVAGCVAAFATGAGGIVLAVPCGLAITNILVDYSSYYNDEVELSASAIGYAANTIGCATVQPFACLSLLTDLVDDVIGLFEIDLQENEGVIASITGALRYGGIWDRRDSEIAWFYIGEVSASDIFWQENDECYRYSYGSFTSYIGNIFTYAVSTGGSVSLRYDLDGTGSVLTVTRLSDEFSVVMDKTSFSLVDFSPECTGRMTNNNDKIIHDILYTPQ